MTPASMTPTQIARRPWRTPPLWLVATVLLVTLVGAVLLPQTERRSVALPPPVTATVSVDTSRITGELPATVLGLSFEADLLAATPGFDPSQGNLAPLMRTLGTGYLKVGANAVDDYVYWNPAGAPVPAWAKTPIGRPEIDRLAELSTATGWPVELAVNLARFDPDRVADEARYAAARLGNRLVAMQCGNEPNGYAGRIRPRGYGYAQYRTEFESCAQALASGGAKVAGPNTYAESWVTEFARDQHDRVALLTDQPYGLVRTPGRTPTVSDLLSPATVAAELRSLTVPLAAARTYHLPLRRDETNSANLGGIKGVSDVYGAALWTVDYTLLLARQGLSGLNFHGTLGRCDQPDADGRVRYYTPLCAANADNLATGLLTARPVYYGMLMVHLLGPGHFLTAKVTGAGNITAYPVRGQDGRTRVMVINKDPVADHPVTVALRLGGHTAEVLRLTGTALDSAAGIAIQGATVRTDGTFTPGPADRLTAGTEGFHLTMQPGSAALMTVTG